MNNAYEIAAATYLLIGIFLGTIGPAGKNIAKEVDRARGSPMTNAFMERAAPSEIKLFFFRITITLGFVLLWPFFIYGIMKDLMRLNFLSVADVCSSFARTPARRSRALP